MSTHPHTDATLEPIKHYNVSKGTFISHLYMRFLKIMLASVHYATNPSLLTGSLGYISKYSILPNLRNHFNGLYKQFAHDSASEQLHLHHSMLVLKTVVLIPCTNINAPKTTELFSQNIWTHFVLALNIVSEWESQCFIHFWQSL